MLRAVVDVNVLVSAALSPEGSPAVVVDAWRAGRFELVASPALLAELEDVTARARLSTRLGDAGQALAGLLSATALVQDDPPAERSVPGDPSDDYLVALARAAGASVIVTGDHHLLDLEGLRPPAIEPGAFLSLIERLP